MQCVSLSVSFDRTDKLLNGGEEAACIKQDFRGEDKLLGIQLYAQSLMQAR